MPDAHEAKRELGQWFMKMPKEIDEDNVTDPAVIADLHDRIAQMFADCRTVHGIGMRRLGTQPGPHGRLTLSVRQETGRPRIQT
jgi:hypothetical protein